jgi:hypothetical protein
MLMLIFLWDESPFVCWKVLLKLKKGLNTLITLNMKDKTITCWYPAARRKARPRQDALSLLKKRSKPDGICVLPVIQDIDRIYLKVKHTISIHMDRVGFLCNRLENCRSRSFDILSVTLLPDYIKGGMVTSSISRASHSLEVRTLDKLIGTLINRAHGTREASSIGHMAPCTWITHELNCLMHDDNSLKDVASSHKGGLSWTNYIICYCADSNIC